MPVFHRFILLLIVAILAACSPAAAGTNGLPDDTLPAGDAQRGAALFTQSVDGAPSCTTCHTLDGTTRVGPSLEGYSAVAGERVEGLSAEAYTQTSITRPAAYIVDGFGNSMYPQYANRLDPQQVADLVAYLLTL